MKINTLFIDPHIRQDSELDDEIQYIQDRLDVRPQIIDHITDVYDHVNSSPDPILCAKQTLLITHNQGAVVRDCPGTSYYTCCDYTILHTGTFCSMDCSYCILQAYFHPPVLQYFAGLAHLAAGLESIFAKNRIFRIGTGEFTDSLIWEPISRQPEFLVQTFARQKNCILELKTKTTHIDSLLALDHNQKTILSWSVNTPAVIRLQERGTRTLTQRLAAARKAQNAGFKLAFHFDPLVVYNQCIPEYKQVIDQIFEWVSPEHVVWISIGSFRFMPALKPIIENRFPSSDICYGEFILGLDNKMRYFKPIRIQLYHELIGYLKRLAPEVLVYFCMEDQQVWEQCMGFHPSKEGELGHLLDRSAARHCRLDHSLL